MTLLLFFIQVLALFGGLLFGWYIFQKYMKKDRKK